MSGSNIQNETRSFELRRQLFLAKAICTLVMIVVHTTVWIALALAAISQRMLVLPEGLQRWYAVGFFSLSIPALACANLRLQLEKGRGAPQFIYRRLIVTSILLIVAGFLLNYFSCGVRTLFYWDVLPFIGFSFLILLGLHRLGGEKLILVVGVVSLCVTEPLRALDQSHHNYLTRMLVGSTNEPSLWPMFPWFFTAALGFVVSDCFLRFGTKLCAWLFPIGALLVIAVWWSGSPVTVALDRATIWGPAVFRPPVSVIVAWTGVYFMMMAVLSRIDRAATFRPYGLVNCYARGLLWIYGVHIIFGYAITENIAQTFAPPLLYFLAPFAMVSLCWGIGAIAVWLNSRRLLIRVKRVNHDLSSASVPG